MYWETKRGKEPGQQNIVMEFLPDAEAMADRLVVHEDDRERHEFACTQCDELLSLLLEYFGKYRIQKQKVRGDAACLTGLLTDVSLDDDSKHLYRKRRTSRTSQKPETVS